ncbi:hypothetical protein D2Q93_04795 [Alicyclobacillaceae bacterium I2511]|nr:hypothetical protein D2Q93_04795 [Alicyclobacillaceae bacterium I2511]
MDRGRNLDIVIRQAFILPGEGAGFTGDVAIADGRIVAVDHHLPGVTGAVVVNGEGLTLCPGFIDMHAHTALESFQNPWLEPKVEQSFEFPWFHMSAMRGTRSCLQ